MIKVLVIDDDKLARKGLVSLMNWEHFGMTVIGDVQNGKAGISFVRENPVDLVFVDIDMPEMNGIEFMEECRKLKPEIQFVVLSFFEDFSYVQATLRLGGLDYISKTSMELDNCDTILQRIAEKYQKGTDRRNEKKNDRQSKEEEMSPILGSIRRDFRAQYWMFNDDAFEKLKEKVRRVEKDSDNVRCLEMLLSRYIGEFEQMLEAPETMVPLFTDAEEMLEWVADYRSQVYENVETWVSGSDAERILKAIVFMKKHLAEDISTNLVAEHIGCSRSYFCIIFKKLSGVSFGYFLQQIRMNHAKELLRETKGSVTEIAFQSGYNDIYYFNRVFRKTVECSPMEYRKRAGGQSD